jgi:photosystem II stability/assembly factor-like uncharacterized protein
LDFRDVHAVDANTAYLLAAGAGDLARIYKTGDGGKSWTLQFKNQDPRAFFDAFAFWDAEHGIALGDPVDGRFMMLTTDNGGSTWNRLGDAELPPALEGEGAFAASGTCLVTEGNANVWFGTGGARETRVFRSRDRGRSWTVAPTPIRSPNASSGIFSVAFRDTQHGIAVGGDYKSTGESAHCVAITHDGGRTWLAPKGISSVAGFRSAIAFVPASGSRAWLAVGPNGSDFSHDDGQSWKPLSTMGFHALSVAGNVAWAAGENGLLAKCRTDALGR